MEALPPCAKRQLHTLAASPRPVFLPSCGAGMPARGPPGSQAPTTVRLAAKLLLLSILATAPAPATLRPPGLVAPSPPTASLRNRQIGELGLWSCIRRFGNRGVEGAHGFLACRSGRFTDYLIANGPVSCRVRRGGT